MSNILYRLPMDYVRGTVAKLCPFLVVGEMCDIDVALAYESLIRDNGFRVGFPERPQGKGRSPSGVQVGTLKSRRIRASRSQVRFNWVWVTT